MSRKIPVEKPDIVESENNVKVLLMKTSQGNCEFTLTKMRKKICSFSRHNHIGYAMIFV